VNTVKIYQLDALEFLAKVPDETVDVCITDPPYWTLNRWRNMGTTTRMGGHRDKDEQRDEMFYETIDQDYLWRFFLELDRVTKLDGHLYMMCDDRVAPILLNWIREAYKHRFGDAHLLIWDKVNQGMGYHYRRRYECIVFAWREKREGVKAGKRKLADLGIPDVLAHKRITGEYPTQKPEALVRTFVTQSARKGDVLLDPFAGSGVLGAAVPEDMDATVILNDKSESSVKWMREKTFNVPGERNIIWHVGDDALNAPVLLDAEQIRTSA
jgi:site-specific DNA-methyltransferase (adenine-specific)